MPPKRKSENWSETSVNFTGNLEEDDDNEGCLEFGGIVIPPPPPPALTFDPTGPRLFISKIVIENFKSYGGQTTLGPFHKNFAAVIGPNGSGKSNVIDALLFVFGYRAQKIRSKTVGVLIHNSDAFPNCNSCRVGVHFAKIIDKGKDDFEVVDGSQFVVSRVAHKDNSSYYLVDDRRVMFKEVSQLLRSHGIDLDHNRFLILQGEVEQISLMKPIASNPHETGMLEFLEDLIGTGRLKEPIAQLQRRVDDLTERRSEKLNRVKTAEADKDELEGLKDEALEFIKLKNEAATKNHTLVQHTIYNRNKRVMEKEQQSQAVEQENVDFLTNYKNLEEEIKSCGENAGQLSEKHEGIVKRWQESQDKYAKLELEDVSNREDVRHCKDKIKKYQLDLKKETAKIEELSEAPDKLLKEIEELEEARNVIGEKKVEAEAKLAEVTSSLKSDTAEIQAEKEVQEKKLFEEQSIVNDLKSKVDIAFSELDLCTKEEENEQTKWESLKINLSTVEANLVSKKSDVKNLKDGIPKLEEAVKKSVNDLKNVVETEPQVVEKFRVLRSKLEDARHLKQNESNRNRLVSALMREKAEGRISGIIGRLGDLGGIDAKYDVAVSTALPQLDNIVTDTFDTAIECVNFLKKNNLGQATFIALDKMSVWKQYVEQKITTPSNVPRLFDLIKVKDKSLLPAFYFVARDTLVADNIELATTIGLRGQKRYRVVTLKGELVELSGTMSGGGSRPMRGRMGTSAVEEGCSAEELQEMEHQLRQLQQQRDDVVSMRAHLEETIARQERELESKRHALQQTVMEIEAMEKQAVVLKPQIKDQEAKYRAAKTDPEKVAQLKTVLEQHQFDFAAAEKTALKSKARVIELHERIMEVGGTKLKAAQKVIDEVNLKLNKVTEEINKKTVAIKASKRNHVKAVENKAKMESEIVDMQQKIVNLKDKIKGAEETGEALTKEKEALENEKRGAETDLKLVQKNLKQLQSTKAQMKEKRLDIQNDLDKIKVELQSVRAELKAWKDKLSKIKHIEMDGVEVQPFQTLDDEQLSALNATTLEVALTAVEDRLRGMKPNLGVIAQYKEKEELYLQRVEEFDAITKDRDDMRKCYDDLRKRRFNEFMNGYTIISHKLKETYQMLTLGGDADLELVNSLDPFSDGIAFSVRPPRKSWKNISNLSGGEKTLSSLSLVFALHYYKPTPFYIMDEIDAALDFRNVAIVAHYIKEQTKNAQFIVVSLRENMFEQANRLIGVYKTHDTSHSICVDINRFEDPLPKANAQ